MMKHGAGTGGTRGSNIILLGELLENRPLERLRRRCAMKMSQRKHFECWLGGLTDMA
jgi:hypothetical protein